MLGFFIAGVQIISFTLLTIASVLAFIFSTIIFLASCYKRCPSAIMLSYEAEANGTLKVLESKARGYRSLIDSCGGDSKAAATMLMIEKMEEIVKTQVEAIKNLKIDKITVWDSANGEKGSATANFVFSLVKSLPPIHDIAGMAGIELPDYFGHVKAIKDGTKATNGSSAKPNQKRPE